MNYPQALLVPLKSMCYSIIVMGPQSHAPSLLCDASRGGVAWASHAPERFSIRRQPWGLTINRTG